MRAGAETGGASREGGREARPAGCKCFDRGGKGVRCEISEGLILRFAHGACGRGTQSVKGLFEVEWSLVSVYSKKNGTKRHKVDHKAPRSMGWYAMLLC